MPLEMIIFTGLQGSGKSTYYREHFADTHALVSKDLLRNNSRPERRQRQLIEEHFRHGRSVVVDNTNASPDDRAPLIELARNHGARVIAIYFDVPVKTCLERNDAREGKACVPHVGIFATLKRMKRPELAEGFDEVRVVEQKDH